jgi:single-strand DNA-binding protein
MDGIAAACQGRLGGDGELKFTVQGQPLYRFTLAVQDAYARERGDPPQWVRVVVFGERAAHLAEDGLPKGAEVYCEGRLRLGRWTAADGGERSDLELVAVVVQPLARVGRAVRVG